MLTDDPGSQPLGNFQVGSVSTHAPSDAIIVPDAHLLFTGDFKRSGVDLVCLPRTASSSCMTTSRAKAGGAGFARWRPPHRRHRQRASRVHAVCAGRGSASVAQVIGHVTKLTGNATAIRNGVSIILNQGDNVNKGDVVQSGSDSTLGITFIDGTVFGLASNAKMVLNKMVYDPNGSDNKSLLSLVQGTISFVAGATAKKGDMKVERRSRPWASAAPRCWSRSTSKCQARGRAAREIPGAGRARWHHRLLHPVRKTTLTPIATVNQAGTQTIINGQGRVNFLSSVQLSPDAQRSSPTSSR